MMASIILATLVLGACPMIEPPAATVASTADQHASAPPVTLNTPRSFPSITDLPAWRVRRDFIRRRILAACGLWPLPEKTPLQPRISGRIVRDGYTIEKVAIQTYPGFYLCGNLYRPADDAPAPGVAPGRDPERRRFQTGERIRLTSSEHYAALFRAGAPAAKRRPAVLIAHGHWQNGRMANEELGSIPARAITFAREGYVAFTYDMVGYNDTRQIAHTFAGDARHWLWGVSLMGLQTWNSIRALDFLESLPDVDPKRIAITGESGGGTQTMILGALDDRLAAVAPCVMVSHTMQGGCLCENAPLLRIDFSNMEIAACAAPKPQIMVGATGDWTATMATVEGPDVESVYRLQHHPERLQYVVFDYPHNINKTSREAVYRFFGKWLLHDPQAESLSEPPYEMEPVADLRVFPEGAPLPKDAKDANALTDYLTAQTEQQLKRAKPRDRQSLDAFCGVYRPLWEQTLAVGVPGEAEPRSRVVVRSLTGRLRSARVELVCGEQGDPIRGVLYQPKVRAADENRSGQAVVVIGDGAGAGDDSISEQFCIRLAAAGLPVLALEPLSAGARASERGKAQQTFQSYFCTYNRTDAQERVRALITACAWLRREGRARSVALVGRGSAGLLALLAAPAVDAVAADCAQTDLTTDDALLQPALYVPCLRKLGDFRTCATLAAPHPLWLHNVGERFVATDWISDVYRSLRAGAKLHVSTAPASDDEIATWLLAMRGGAGRK